MIGDGRSPEALAGRICVMKLSDEPEVVRQIMWVKVRHDKCAKSFESGQFYGPGEPRFI